MICKICGTEYEAKKCTCCGLSLYANPTVNKLHFGKYRGLTVEQVYAISPNYLRWMINHNVGSGAQLAKARLLLYHNKTTADRPPLDPNFAEGDYWYLGHSNSKPTPSAEWRAPYQIPSMAQSNQPTPQSQSSQTVYWNSHPESASQLSASYATIQAQYSMQDRNYWGWRVLVIVILLVLGGLVINLGTSRTTSTLSKPTTPSSIIVTRASIAPDSFVVDNNYAILASFIYIRETPSDNGKVLETAGLSGIVAWQRRTTDGQWYERAGGGWVANKDVLYQCFTEEACLAILNPQITDSGSLWQVPTATPSPQSRSTPSPQDLSARGELVYSTATCLIKGNISYDTHEPIYHVPGQRYYDDTIIDPHYGERWFCTEQHAVNNGWRKSTE